MSAGAQATDLPGSTSAPRRPLAVRIARRGARFVGRNLLGTITHVRTTEAVAALTFDDGPDPENTPALLEILARHGAKATFFMLGMHARRHPGEGLYGILPPLHRLGARVRLAAGHRHFIGLLALDPGNDADHGACGFQNVCLLDMRLDVGMDREAERPASDVRKAVVNALQRLADADAVRIANRHHILEPTQAGEEL